MQSFLNKIKLNTKHKDLEKKSVNNRKQKAGSNVHKRKNDFSCKNKIFQTSRKVTNFVLYELLQNTDKEIPPTHFMGLSLILKPESRTD